MFYKRTSCRQNKSSFCWFEEMDLLFHHIYIVVNLTALSMETEESHLHQITISLVDSCSPTFPSLVWPGLPHRRETVIKTTVIIVPFANCWWTKSASMAANMRIPIDLYSIWKLLLTSFWKIYFHRCLFRKIFYTILFSQI